MNIFFLCCNAVYSGLTTLNASAQTATPARVISEPNALHIFLFRRRSVEGVAPDSAAAIWRFVISKPRPPLACSR
jgi:hypothetical protein